MLRIVVLRIVCYELSGYELSAFRFKMIHLQNLKLDLSAVIIRICIFLRTQYSQNHKRQNQTI